MDEGQHSGLPGEAVSWPGSWKLAGDPLAEWTPCQVVEISPLGVGLTTLHPGTDLLGRQLLVFVGTPVGAAVSLRILAPVHVVRPRPDGQLLVGLQFADLAAEERSVLNALSQLQVVW